MNFNKKLDYILVGSITALGITILGAGLCARYDLIERGKITSEYASLPITNIVAKIGDTTDSLTGKRVDMDRYPLDVRRPQFAIDNNITNFIIYPHIGYRVREDKKYLEEKAKKNRGSKK